jgi:hypothetical protein
MSAARPLPKPEPEPAGDAPARPTLRLLPAPRTDLPPRTDLARARLPRRAPAAAAAAPLDDAGGSVPPDLDAWVGRLAAAVMEVLHGTRPAGQLTRWLAPRVHRALADRAARVRPLRDGPPLVCVRSVRTSQRPGDGGRGAVEAAVVVAVGPRCRAVALRLEPYAQRWRITALEVG